MGFLRKIWRKASPWIVAILCVLFVLSVVGNFFLELKSNRLQISANQSQNNHHAASVKDDNQIKALVQQLASATAANHKLGKSNNALAQEIIRDSATVTADAGIVAQQNAAICSALNIPASACPGAP